MRPIFNSFNPKFWPISSYVKQNYTANQYAIRKWDFIYLFVQYTISVLVRTFKFVQLALDKFHTTKKEAKYENKRKYLLQMLLNTRSEWNSKQVAAFFILFSIRPNKEQKATFLKYPIQ